jgi:glycerol-3-phosphate dehydrogenase
MTSLDLDTLLGEVDWVVGHEDAHLPSDVLLRRTDLGYGEAGENVREPLLGRMAQLLGWDEAQRRRAEEDFDSTLRRRDAWREDT